MRALRDREHSEGGENLMKRRLRAQAMPREVLSLESCSNGLARSHPNMPGGGRQELLVPTQLLTQMAECPGDQPSLAFSLPSSRVAQACRAPTPAPGH